MTGRFDPRALTPAVSLNRVQIVDLPGIALPEAVRGKTAYDLLASPALTANVLHHRDALGLTAAEVADGRGLLRRFDACFAAVDPAVRAAAEAIAREGGAALGYLLLTLRRGDAANRLARPDWDESYWAHWAGVRAIFLGGGVVSGQFGARLVDHAMRTLRDAGMGDCLVRRARWPTALPLLGAARAVARGGAVSLVFDFGQTLVKRAVSRDDGEAIVGLGLLPTLPSHWLTTPPDPSASHDQARRLADYLVEVVAATWREVAGAGVAPGPVVGVSIASYVHDGQPLSRQGGPYAALNVLTPNLAAWLGEQLSARVGQSVSVVLLHDGTAAGLALAGKAQAAVIMVGTALGVGFPPDGGAVRRLAPDCAVEAYTGRAVAEPPPG